MLFYYPKAAADENNWLNGWFVQSINDCFEAVDNGQAVPLWAELTATRVAELRARNVVETEFYDLVSAYEAASVPDRSATKQAIAAQQDAATACATGSCPRITDLPDDIENAAIKFGARLFWLLGQLEIRERHYEHLWETLQYNNDCPFCAMHDLNHPELTAEDLDHYMSRKIYPFAAGDLRNLAPMCPACNMDSKGTKDVLSGGGNINRHYPYDNASAGGVDLLGSRFFVNGDDQPPAWEINLLPPDKADEWDRVFDVRRRFRLNVLDLRYMDWLKEWADTLPNNASGSVDDIRKSMRHWSEVYAGRGTRDKSFLKSAYFRLVDEILSQIDVTSEQMLAIVRYQMANRPRIDA